MFDVVQYWNALCEKAGIEKDWNTLNPVQQQMILQSINLLLKVLYDVEHHE